MWGDISHHSGNKYHTHTLLRPRQRGLPPPSWRSEVQKGRWRQPHEGLPLRPHKSKRHQRPLRWFHILVVGRFSFFGRYFPSCLRPNNHLLRLPPSPCKAKLMHFLCRCWRNHWPVVCLWYYYPRGLADSRHTARAVGPFYHPPCRRKRAGVPVLHFQIRSSRDRIEECEVSFRWILDFTQYNNILVHVRIFISRSHTRHNTLLFIWRPTYAHTHTHS